MVRLGLTEAVGSNEKPRARTRNLVTQAMSGEVLVYDLDANKAHCLNSSAAAIWELCDGEATKEQIMNRLNAQIPGSVDDNSMSLAITQLREVKLLDN